MWPAVAFDVTGVLHLGSKAIPRALEALMMLKDRGVPFVLLTNAGGRLESERADMINKLLGTDIITERNVIQSHTPMKMIYRYMVENK
jgi:HAD superfamily hydrolase (TIGR01450 family)